MQPLQRVTDWKYFYRIYVRECDITIFWNENQRLVIDINHKKNWDGDNNKAKNLAFLVILMICFNCHISSHRFWKTWNSTLNRYSETWPQVFNRMRIRRTTYSFREMISTPSWFRIMGRMQCSNIWTWCRAEITERPALISVKYCVIHEISPDHKSYKLQLNFWPCYFYRNALKMQGLLNRNKIKR